MLRCEVGVGVRVGARWCWTNGGDAPDAQRAECSVQRVATRSCCCAHARARSRVLRVPPLFRSPIAHPSRPMNSPRPHLPVATGHGCLTAILAPGERSCRIALDRDDDDDQEFDARSTIRCVCASFVVVGRSDVCCVIEMTERQGGRGKKHKRKNGLISPSVDQRDLSGRISVIRPSCVCPRA